MFRPLAVALLAVALATPAVAQTPPGGPGPPQPEDFLDLQHRDLAIAHGSLLPLRAGGVLAAKSRGGRMVLKNSAQRGGMVLQNSRERSPIILKTDN